MPRILCTPLERALIDQVQSANRLRQEAIKRARADAQRLEEQAKKLRDDCGRAIEEGERATLEALRLVAEQHGLELGNPEDVELLSDPSGGVAISWPDPSPGETPEDPAPAEPPKFADEAPGEG